MPTVPDLPPHCGSWIVTRRDTGEAVIELFSRTLAERVNHTRYEVHTAADYLVSLNRRIKAQR